MKHVKLLILIAAIVTKYQHLIFRGGGSKIYFRAQAENALKCEILKLKWACVVSRAFL